MTRKRAHANGAEKGVVLSRVMTAMQREEQGKRVVTQALRRLASLQEAGNQTMAALVRGLAMMEGGNVQVKEMANDPETGQLQLIVYVTAGGEQKTLNAEEKSDSADRRSAAGLWAPGH